MENKKQVLIIGAGPVGIAAAAHVLARGMQPLVLERGPVAGHAILEWGHVRLFTPWKYLVDKAVEPLLRESGWIFPEADVIPTGREFVESYLAPAAEVLKSHIEFNTEVVKVTKIGLNKSLSIGRDEAGFTVQVKAETGEIIRHQAGAVIDSSGTWFSPNPIGLDGLSVDGEVLNGDLIHYGIPDVLNAELEAYAGKRTLVLGGGHSAINAALDLLKLQERYQGTKVSWGLRNQNIEKLLGGGINDELPARGELGLAAQNAINSGALNLLPGLSIQRLQRSGESMLITATSLGEVIEFEVDRIIVVTGFRPNLDILSELRLDLDVIVEAPILLAPMIDPNLHSCGTVKPHGIDELCHVDRGFYIVGMKSYGRAPTFLMLTGYEQVRSIAAELAGDHKAARIIELDLPETGVCSSNLNAGNVNETSAGSSCCA